MKITVEKWPASLGPDGEKLLKKELLLARDQMGAEYVNEVKHQIRTAKPYPPVYETTMVSGIQFQRLEGFAGQVMPSPVSMPYAVVQELGRRPNQPGPPFAPILKWVERKFGLSGTEAKQRAAAVRHKLHTKGMEGRFFFDAARKSKRARKMAVAFVKAAFRRWWRSTQ